MDQPKNITFSNIFKQSKILISKQLSLQSKKINLQLNYDRAIKTN